MWPTGTFPEFRGHRTRGQWCGAVLSVQGSLADLQAKPGGFHSSIMRRRAASRRSDIRLENRFIIA